MLKTSPGRMAARDFLICLAICVIVAVVDHDSVFNSIRLGIMLLVIISVPAINYMFYRQRARAVG